MTDQLAVKGENLSRLRRFVSALAQVVDDAADEAALLSHGGDLLRELIAVDDWLPEAYAQPHPDHYQQYLLHCDSRERFSVVSFVWGPGQATPVHDHTVWGLIGVLRGAERVTQWQRREDGSLGQTGAPEILRPGEVEAVSPRIGDIHQVANGTQAVSVSIHVYGANIGAVSRHAFASDGTPKTFVSGYANTVLPNLWDARAA